MKTAFLAHCRHASIGALVLCATVMPGFAGTPAPVKLAIFDFELEDFSAAASLVPENPVDIARLQFATSEARRLIAQSGRYEAIDVSGADGEAVKAHWLRKCNGCDAGIALKLGADQSVIGVVTKISMTEYTVQFRISDARTGAIISILSTDLRMGTNDSWSRGAAWLITNRLLDGKDGSLQQSQKNLSK